jgi:hypothetical protein
MGERHVLCDGSPDRRTYYRLFPNDRRWRDGRRGHRGRAKSAPSFPPMRQVSRISLQPVAKPRS